MSEQKQGGGTARPDIIVSARAPEPVGPYPHARRVGSLIFVSGMGPRRRGEKQIPGITFDDDGRVLDWDIQVEARAVFDNLRVILEDAGSSLERIVDVTVFLTDIGRDFQAFNQVYGEILGHVQPSRTTVEVGRLPTPIHVELKVIATVDA
ncbi:MAG: Rid family hydrolase [Gemmatimonadota bacterium]